MTDHVEVEVDEHAELVALLHHAQRAIFEHPVAAQAAFAALVAEGREFAKTPEGAAWHERLSNARFIEKAQTIWEGVALNVLEDDASTVIPSRILDGFVRLLHERALDTILAKLQSSR